VGTGGAQNVEAACPPRTRRGVYWLRSCHWS
jgi:hypothetical protein